MKFTSKIVPIIFFRILEQETNAIGRPMNWLYKEFFKYNVRYLYVLNSTDYEIIMDDTLERWVTEITQSASFKFCLNNFESSP